MSIAAAVVIVPATPITPAGARPGRESRTCAAHAESSLRSGWVGAEEALREPDATELRAHPGRDAVGASEDELGRAAADVDEQRGRLDHAVRGRAPEAERRLVLAREEAGREAVAPLDLAEEGFAVRRVARGAGGDREHPLSAEGRGFGTEADEHVADACHGRGEDQAALVHGLAHARDGEPPGHLCQAAVFHVGDEEPGGVAAQVDGCDAHEA